MPDSSTRAPERPFPLIPLIMLAAATFLSVSVEMLPTGLMPFMSEDLGASESQIGLLMTIFAFTVVLLSTPIVYLLQRVPKRLMLVGVLTAFAIGTIGTALAPTYSLVVISRIFTGAAHGVFWATVTSYTGSLVTSSQLTKAVSITGGGGGLAFVLGVPLGTLLGQIFGWRTSFVVVAVICLMVAATLWFVLPKQVEEAPETSAIEVVPAPGAIGDTERTGFDGPRVPRPKRSMYLVTLLILIVAITMAGNYSFYSYISPFLLGIVELPAEWLAAALFAFGIMAAAATFGTGMLFSNRSTLGFAVAYSCMLLGAGALAFVPQVLPLVVVGLGLWGVGMGFLPTLLQSRLLVVAPRKHRDLSSALYTSGFNLGIGGGAFIGGLLLDDYGIWSVAPSFLTLVGCAFVGIMVMDFRQRRAVK
ncbi:MFS transporter [Gulosibacter faecalis]|uniref:MFS transporter n=1 Tax=Gulosibacter faecalis TaxID=272240 RepID=A0ABW5UWY1_9MICO|nr:MFS transporter [Gulosibacter faecalis]